MAAAAAGAEGVAEGPSKESCLFLADWEAARVAAHAVRRKRGESLLCDLQLRARNGLVAIDAWMAILESRRKLEEVAAAATTKAVDDLEAHWRPMRIDACDGEAAAWLLAQERSHAAALAARAGCWAASLPAGGADLRKRHQAAVDELNSPAIAACRAWDAAHEAAQQAWHGHNERLEGAQRAVAEERAPPDSWLSEVRYRERARSHLTEQAAAERGLAKSAEALKVLEEERSRLWEAFVAAYSQASAANAAGGAPQGAPATAPDASKPEAPPLRMPVAPAAEPALQEVPEMPSASGFVQSRLRVAVQAEKGLFGLGGGGWREGATLVLTLHGYMHVFLSDTAAAAAKVGEASEGGGGGESEELVESAIKASVYVPMATRCVFLRRGKDLTVDLAEAEAEEGEKPPGGGAGDRLRKWIGRSASQQAVPRRIFAKVSDPAQFTELEQRCHSFVRRGQGLRAAGGSPAASPEGGGGYPAAASPSASLGAAFSAPAPAPSRPSALETPVKHLVDNSELKVDAPGLEYRLSKNVDDRAGKDVFEKWGATVMGVNTGDGWLKVGGRYLPMNIKGCCVVRRA